MYIKWLCNMDRTSEREDENNHLPHHAVCSNTGVLTYMELKRITKIGNGGDI